MTFERKRELDAIEKFVRENPRRVYKAKLGETSGWDDLSYREKRERNTAKFWGNR